MKKVLIVEDQRMPRENMERILLDRKIMIFIVFALQIMG